MNNATTTPEHKFITETKYIFLKEWKPFDILNKKVERAIINHFILNEYQWQPTNDASSKRPFKPSLFSQIDITLGLAYTSTSDYAGKWVCNGGYLWADNTHYFTGFAVTDKGQVIGIADNMNEETIYIRIGRI